MKKCIYLLAILLLVCCLLGGCAQKAAPPQPTVSTRSGEATTAPRETEPAPATTEIGGAEETEPPATEPPVTEPPATEPPVTEPPATEPPATEPPATEPPADPAQMLAKAESLIGHPVSELYDAIGKPSGGSSYASSCNGPGEDGELYYTNYGFTAYTYREGGEEKVVDVWED